MEVLGAGTAGAAAVNAYGYNRDAWMTDVFLDQTRSHQKQQLLLSQAGMFRDDIRQTIQSSVQRQNNYVIVLALILNMMENFYICSVLPEGTPAILWVGFLVTTGGSMVYLMLAIVFTVWANYLAVNCQNGMLMFLVRLPVSDVSTELEGAAEQESAEAFERQPLDKVLRVPFLRALRSRASGARRRSVSEPPPPGVVRGCPAVRAIEEREAHREACMRLLKLKMAEWHVLGKYTVIFGYLGLSMLLHAFSYFSVAKIYSRGASRGWSCWIMQFLITTMVCALTYVFGHYIKVNKFLRFASVFLELGAQASIFMVVWVESEFLCRLFSSTCFLCHVALNLITVYYKHIASAPSPELLAACRRSKSSLEVPDDTSDAGSLSSNGDEAATLPGDADELVHQRAARRRRVAALGSSIVTLAWLLSTAWALDHTLKAVSATTPAVAAEGRSLASVAPERQLRGSPGLDFSRTGDADVSALRESVAELQRRLAHARLQRARLEQGVARLEAAFAEDAEAGTDGAVLLTGAIDSLVHRVGAASSRDSL